MSSSLIERVCKFMAGIPGAGSRYTKPGRAVCALWAQRVADRIEELLITSQEEDKCQSVSSASKAEKDVGQSLQHVAYSHHKPNPTHPFHQIIERI